MENLNHGESSYNEANRIRSRVELLPKPQLVDLLCKLASQHPSIAQDIETHATVHDVTLHRTLFVRRLSSTTNSRTLRRAFQEYGEIEEAFVVRDRVTTISKNFGFVTYKDIKSAHDALIQPRKAIDGSVAICHLADERHRKTNAPEFSLRRKLYIGDLPAGVTIENLRRVYERHGEIEEAVVMSNGRYGFVTYTTAEAAQTAIDYNTLHPTFAEGRKRIVKYAHNQRGRPPLRSRTPSPEYEQSENDYVDFDASVGYGYPQTAAVLYSPPPYPTVLFNAHSPYPRVYAMTHRFGNQYYYDYSYPNQ